MKLGKFIPCICSTQLELIDVLIVRLFFYYLYLYLSSSSVVSHDVLLFINPSDIESIIYFVLS